MSRKIEGVRIHVRLTVLQHAKLKKAAEKGGYSVSETLRRAIDVFLEDLRKP